MVAPAPIDRELARLTATPLSLEIESTPLPTRFHQPKFTLYNSKTDPYMHVSHYRQMMAGHRRNDALMCLIFLVSLGELGLKWFERLPRGSIEGCQQLAEAFVTKFKTNTRTPKEVDHLLSVKLESSGSLKAYNTKYWETNNEILDCPTNLAIAQYKRGLPVRNRLRGSLTMHQPPTMESLTQWINEHIRVKDDTATTATIEKANSVIAKRWVAGKWINEHIRVKDDTATAATIEKANSVAADRWVAGKVHSVGQEDNRPNN
ncbi:uncharacterized protein LOC114301741 [Camellia sinensis]|uniref:uncharacterized protein LOC114301741 n=1 Tax=Camellia sinensis TaxID=4442 RepID=UPI001035C6F7|nr:uncharacterized protein LOC114301741 [Camellia sinensis]